MEKMNKETIIGVISDTHGNYNRKINDIFKDVDYIFHAGDIGNNDTVMTNLESIAPVYAVRGNCDMGYNTSHLKNELNVEIANNAIYMTHIPHCIDKQKAKDANLVIFGHNHYPEITELGNTKYLNPGSASQGRNGYPCSIALARIKQNNIEIEIVKL